jgi:tRNA-specific 2-thiouridylase
LIVLLLNLLVTLGTTRSFFVTPIERFHHLSYTYRATNDKSDSICYHSAVKSQLLQPKKKVFVGLSGGVDSSVSAALLKAATPNNYEELFGHPTPDGFSGYDVTGVFIKVWQPDFVECSVGDDRRDAMRVALHLGVPFLLFDFAEEYKRLVADYMIEEYRAGRTPNPDVMCNKYVKFGAFLKKAREMGADYVATGHYAEVGHTDAGFALRRSKDENKDQTYFLWTLTQAQLAHTLFPVGCYTKPEVRELARRFGLPTAEKRESQGVCFIGKFDMQEFLEHYIPRKRGAVLGFDGAVVGEHDGAMFYTMGQRHGFHVDSQTAHSTPLYVIGKDLVGNTITVAPREVVAAPATDRGEEIVLKSVSWIAGIPPADGAYEARIRHRQKLQPCKLTMSPEARIIFDESQWGIAAGQSVVLYEGETCLGGGVIV